MVSTPSAPNPSSTANQQQSYNIGSGVAQNALNQVNQVTPYGSVNYAQTGGQMVDGQWVPQSTATTTLSQPVQNVVNQQIANSGAAANTEGQTLANNSASIAAGPDLSWNATQANLDKLAMNTIQPQIQQQTNQLNQQLADQGVTPGSADWNYQQSQNSLSNNQAYDQLYLQGNQQAANQALAQYNAPINAISALQSGSQVSQPGVGQTAATPQASVAAPNYSGLVSQNYQNQLAQSNAAMGGMFGLGGSALTGLGNAASSGTGLLGFLSDENDKTDRQELGVDPSSGLMLEAYRYKGDPKNTPKVVGPMAQDIERKYPGSTAQVGGHMVVKPAAAARFGLGGS